MGVSNKGIIFDIQRYGTHDGPGIRTLVFLKGCPLHCLWCSNPESQSINPELMIFDEKCINCNRCVNTCPNEAIIRFNESRNYIQEKCHKCGKCSDACLTGSIKMIGEYLSIEQVLEEVKKDINFYRKSHGGVTLTGGEPIYQPEFSIKLLETFKKNKINSALETSGYGHWEFLKEILSLTDYLFFDIKFIDEEKHKKFVGVSNSIILENIVRASKLMKIQDKRMVIRIPLIPSITDEKENISKICCFIKSYLQGNELIELLPYHRLGEGKYKRLRREYYLTGLKPPSRETIEKCISIVQDNGLKIHKE